MKRFLDSYGFLLQLASILFLAGMLYSTSKTHTTREETVVIAEEVVRKSCTSKSDGAVILSRLDNIERSLDNLGRKQDYLIGIKQLPE